MKALKVVYIGLIMVLVIISCDREIEIPDTNQTKTTTGTLLVEFKITHPWLSPEKIIRISLNVAKTGGDIYKGNYLQSANVRNTQELYLFYLTPGSYYYEAGIACICGGDTCSAAGFPGNQWGTKHTMGTFIIKANEITTIIPTFR